MTARTPPVWLLAAPFSGVSWLAACLGRHPQLFVTPELDLLLADNVADLLDIFAIGQGTQGQGLLRTIASIEGQRDDDAGVRQAQQWLETRRDWSTADLLQHLATAVAPRTLAIPERDATLRPMALVRLQRLTPQAQVVHLTRHPWEQGVLLEAWARERLYVPVDFKDFAQHPPQIEPQLPWLRANANIAALCERLPTDQWRRIQAEALEQAPVATLTSLAAWLQLRVTAADQQAMQQPAQWPFARPGPLLAPGGAEPEAFEPWSPQVRRLAAAVSLERPLPWRRDGQGFSAAVCDWAQRFGYAAS